MVLSPRGRVPENVVWKVPRQPDHLRKHNVVFSSLFTDTSLSVFAPLKMSTTARHPQSVSQEAKDAMMEYYTLLCRMPHMKPRCPKRPPIEGWSGTHAENLRTQGWSDEAAEISRHLPFLAPGLYDAEHAFIVSLILSLYFSDEELYTIPCFAVSSISWRTSITSTYQHHFSRPGARRQ
jgi:hypothetical protein